MSTPDVAAASPKVVGELTLDWDTFRYAGAPDQQLVLWSAEVGSTSCDGLVALASRVGAAVG